jgi:hypothetical protein
MSIKKPEVLASGAIYQSGINRHYLQQNRQPAGAVYPMA